MFNLSVENFIAVYILWLNLLIKKSETLFLNKRGIIPGIPPLRSELQQLRSSSVISDTLRED